MDTSSINSAIKLVQTVIGLGKKATNLQYEEALLAAREALFLQKETNLDLAEKVSELKNQIKEINLHNDQSKNVEFYGGAYWLDENGLKTGPNCTSCWVDRGKLLRLDVLNMGSVYMSCPSCKASYGHKVKKKFETN